MCGIAAIFNYQNRSRVDRAEMGRMLDDMKRRGPDGSGEWYGLEGAVGLGHRRLSIIDLSENGAQPMASADGKTIVTFNGEIYNYRVLRSELQAKGCQFRSQSDTEILLHLYQLEGQNMVHRLRGMYVFAIWDDSRRGLFLARDPFGIKPLYYSDDGQTFRAASQVKALLAGGCINTAVEPAGHVGFFLWGHVPSPYTLHRGIRALPAGGSLWITESGPASIKTFCNISDLLAIAEPQSSRLDPPSADLLRSALLDTVRHHLIADVPVGVFLSAGLDSTTLAALGAEIGGTLRTVTLGFEEFKGTVNDESKSAALVAAHCGTKHQTVWVTRRDFQNNFARLMSAMDQPTTNGVNSFFISRAAATAGLKVALSGLGGDELFGGYPSFKGIPRLASALAPVPLASVLGRGFRWVSAPVLKQFTSPKYAGLLEYGGSYGGAYLLRRGMFMPWELPELLDHDVVREGWGELQTLSRLEETSHNIRRPRLKVSALEMSWYMRNQLLRDTDWASMDHSVEIRTPLVDVDLLRQLAPLLTGDRPPGKQDMASSCAQKLPHEILNRKKTGFSVPVREWLLRDHRIAGPQTPEHGARGQGAERGLRGWAKLVYAEQAQGDNPLLQARKHHRHKSHPGQPPSSAEAGKCSASRKILVFRIGQLGDTVVALPAMWAVKKHFPRAHITLLSDQHLDKPYVLGSDLLLGTGLFNDFLLYPVTKSAGLAKGWRMAALLATIRARRFDTLAYLVPTDRSAKQVERDRRFFAMAGIKTFLGMEDFPVLEPKIAGTPLEKVSHESDLLLNRLAPALPVREADRGCMDLRLGEREEEKVRTWLGELKPDGGRCWLAVAPGSKMPAKRWPSERFQQVIAQLIEEHDIWPVVFGGPEDQGIANSLLKSWGRGYNAAGALGLRPAAAALKRCILFLGNDTGTMHLAAAVGLPCVAIFSCRERPGLWYPYGDGHRVFRAQVECEGCQLFECVERQNECLNQIHSDPVAQSCMEIIQRRLSASK